MGIVQWICNSIFSYYLNLLLQYPAKTPGPHYILCRKIVTTLKLCWLHCFVGFVLGNGMNNTLILWFLFYIWVLSSTLRSSTAVYFLSSEMFHLGFKNGLYVMVANKQKWKLLWKKITMKQNKNRKENDIEKAEAILNDWHCSSGLVTSWSFSLQWRKNGNEEMQMKRNFFSETNRGKIRNKKPHKKTHKKHSM